MKVIFRAETPGLQPVLEDVWRLPVHCMYNFFYKYKYNDKYKYIMVLMEADNDDKEQIENWSEKIQNTKYKIGRTKTLFQILQNLKFDSVDH